MPDSSDSKIYDASLRTEPSSIAIAKIFRTRGLRGEVVAVSLTSRPERFDDILTLQAISPDGVSRTLEISTYRVHGSQLVLQFAGFDTIEKAQPLVGYLLTVPAEEAIPLEPDEYFLHQLVGCSVETIQGKPLGQVVRVLESTGTPVLIVQGTEGRERMIPLSSSICPTVDTQQQKIVVDPPEGLLEL